VAPGPIDDPVTLPAVGTAVRTEGFFYVADPRTDLGLDFSEVSIACPLGSCPAWYVAGTRDTWVILTHGRGVDRQETLRMLEIVHAAGYPALAVTYRNDDGAPATDGLVRFGQEEWPDLAAAIDYALAQGAADVILAGFSTGGAISMATVLESDQADAVRAVILDAPMLDFRRTVELAAQDRSLPVVGLPIPSTLVATSTWLAGTRFDLDYSAIDYVARAGELTVPVLILMGTDDTTVYPDSARELAAARSDLVTLVEFPGASHVRSWNIDTPRYTDTVNDFLASTAD
jgi:alpha-beta hydrolase superfamily lysophospholipase